MSCGSIKHKIAAPFVAVKEFDKKWEQSKDLRWEKMTARIAGVNRGKSKKTRKKKT